MAREVFLPLTVWLLSILAVVAVMTGAYLVSDAHECAHQGGVFSIEGGTAWCRF